MRVLLIFTTFPVPTETFLQREVEALQVAGRPVELWSLWGGGDSFRDQPIRRVPWTDLFGLFFWLPYWLLRRPRAGLLVLGALGHIRWRNWTNLGENLLGLGLGVVRAREIERTAGPDTRLHGVWASLPAAFAWTVHRLTGLPFSFAAHAYDLFEHGGDGMLGLKLGATEGIRTSTGTGRERLRELGARADQIVVIPRGLCRLPTPLPARPERAPIRLLAVGRFVPKMGFDLLADIFDGLAEAELSFVARVIGDGPEFAGFAERRANASWSDQVELLGAQPFVEVESALRWADVLLFTGKVARSGDRAGFPNIVGEALAAGCPVVATPVGAVAEQIQDGGNGLLAVDHGGFVAAIRRLQEDPELFSRLATAGPDWARSAFDAHRHMARFWEWVGRAEGA